MMLTRSHVTRSVCEARRLEVIWFKINCKFLRVMFCDLFVTSRIFARFVTGLKTWLKRDVLPMSRFHTVCENGRTWRRRYGHQANVMVAWHHDYVTITRSKVTLASRQGRDENEMKSWRYCDFLEKPWCQRDRYCDKIVTISVTMTYPLLIFPPEIMNQIWENFFHTKLKKIFIFFFKNMICHVTKSRLCY